MVTTALLDARQLSRRHPDGRQWLLEDVSLTVHAGERIALVGPSGSGKTLTLRALVLLDPLDSGETRWQGRVVRREMIPITNTMMVVGLVSLPGMMTGQILAGAEPMQAVMYQIVIMFLIAAGTSLGACSTVLLGYLRLFNHDHQFLAARLIKRG